jgi:cleavage stimulation factor subunit 3
VNIQEIRSAYIRAISTPLLDLEEIWKDYEAFENTFNKNFAEKMFKKHSPIYTKSRNALYELKSVYEDLNKDMLAVEPRSNFEETQQVFIFIINFVLIFF